MKYAYEDLSPNQFEDLVVLICQKLLGISVQGFTPGPDGGRDAKFVGTAELHPSRTSPWIGTTIIQAKHTNGYNKHFSESDFFSTTGTSAIIAKEIPKIIKLRKQGQLDNYMLFSNRRLSGIAESEIKAYIASHCKMPEQTIYLCDTQQIEVFLKTFPDIPQMANLDPVDAPLLVNPDEFADMIQAFSRQRSALSEIPVSPPVPRVHYEEKNRLNSMSIDYAAEQRRRYLKETRQIDVFLSAPENEAIRDCYTSVTEEFQMQILSKRREHQNFDEVLEYLVRLLFDRDPILNSNKRLTRMMLFYMYWNCDIGVNEHATTN